MDTQIEKLVGYVHTRFQPIYVLGEYDRQLEASRLLYLTFSKHKFESLKSRRKLAVAMYFKFEEKQNLYICWNENIYETVSTIWT